MLGTNSKVYVPSRGTRTVKELLDDKLAFLRHNKEVYSGRSDKPREEFWLIIDTNRVPELAHIDEPGWRIAKMAYESLARQGYRTVEE